MQHVTRYLGFGAVFIATVVAIVVFSATMVRAFVVAPAEPELVYIAPPLKMHAPAEAREAPLPWRLQIPSIGVDAVIQHVGVGTSGHMAVPNTYADVGWYRYGTTPGSIGSAVIAGHVDNGLGLPGVFNQLPLLREGDEITVRAVDGTEQRFAVTSVETYKYGDVPLDTLFNRSDGKRLNLITCAGGWIAGKWVYDRRVIAYAELIE